MLKKHQELLETIQAAEKQARALYAQGCQVDGIATGLRDLGGQVKERIRVYQATERPGKPPGQPKKEAS